MTRSREQKSVTNTPLIYMLLSIAAIHPDLLVYLIDDVHDDDSQR